LLGATDGWYNAHEFTVNEMDWVNWPDFMCRVYKNDPGIRYTNSLHEVITGCKKKVALEALPQLAILHVKAVEKDNNRWTDGKYQSPANDNLYDTLI